MSGAQKIARVQPGSEFRVIEAMEDAGWRVVSISHSLDRVDIEFRRAREWGGWVSGAVMLALCAVIVWSLMAILGGGA